jgi:Ricin-type beta-trefoil lectin domain
MMALATTGLIANTTFPNLITFAKEVKTNQANQINLELPISLTEAKKFLGEKVKFKNLKSASFTAIIDTNNHTIPVQLGYDASNPDSIISQYTKTKQSLIDGINIAKKNPSPAIQKFDRNNILKTHKLSETQRPSVAPKLTEPNPATPPIATVSESDLQYYETNGTLPLMKPDETQIREKIKELGLPADYPIPHLDPKLRGKLAGATRKESLASMTETEKRENNTRVEESRIQEEIITQTTQEDLNNLQKTENQDQIKIISISYLTDVGDKTAKSLTTKTNKEFRTQSQEEDRPKASKRLIINQATNPQLANSSKLEDNIKSIVAQDITAMFQTNLQEEQIQKSKTQKDLEDYKSRAIKGAEENKPQQHSQSEADMFKKDGIDIEALGGEIIDNDGSNLTKVKKEIDKTNDKLSSIDLESILSIGSLKGEAKGLNNAKNSLIIYNAVYNNLAFHADTQYNWQQLKMRYTSGSYGQQRFCFENDSNKIYLTNEGACNGTWGKQCLHALGGNSYGGSVGLYDCNFQNGNDTNQKWYFDEYGRLVMWGDPSFCVDSAGPAADGHTLVTWGCNTQPNQMWRAGYNSFGNYGMTIWAINQSLNQYFAGCIGACSNGFNPVGHSFVELWNSNGTHNTFSRWNFNDNDCNNQNGWSLNNICDRDAITVDVEIDLKNNPTPTKYASFRKQGIYISKIEWDKLVFGSGFRDNYKNGLNYDIGGIGTYFNNYICLANGCYSAGIYSRSRDSNYYAQYTLSGNYFSLADICSSYSVKLWHAYRSGNGVYFGSTYIIPADIFNQI